MTKFSIIIPNTNSILIKQIIESLKLQSVDLSNGEIIIVGPDEPDLIGKNDPVRLIQTDQHNCYASDKRNIGMKSAKGEIFFFLDDDCLPRADWVERHLEQHQNGEKVVGGAIEFNSENYYQLADNISQFHDLMPNTSPGRRNYLSTANLSVHRSVVTHSGEMEAHKNRAEDLEWTVRFRTNDYQLYFEPRAIISHDPPRRCFPAVWQHWIADAPDTLSVRLRYAKQLNTPRLARHRSAFLLGIPLIAAWATARTFSNPQVSWKYWYTLPLVYLTKLAWCLSAYQNFNSNHQ